MDGFLPLKAGGFASNLTQKLGKFRLSVDQIGEAMVDVSPRRSHNATPSPHVNTVMGKPMHMRMLSRK
jgi:hypothetical protein